MGASVRGVARHLCPGSGGSVEPSSGPHRTSGECGGSVEENTADRFGVRGSGWLRTRRGPGLELERDRDRGDWTFRPVRRSRRVWGRAFSRARRRRRGR